MKYKLSVNIGIAQMSVPDEKGFSYPMMTGIQSYLTRDIEVNNLREAAAALIKYQDIADAMLGLDAGTT